MLTWSNALIALIALFELVKAALFIKPREKNLPPSSGEGEDSVRWLLRVIGARSVAIAFGLIWTTFDAGMGFSWLIAAGGVQVLDLAALWRFTETPAWKNWDDKCTKRLLTVGPVVYIALVGLAIGLR